MLKNIRDHLTEDQINASDVVHFYDIELNNLQNPFTELLRKYSKLTHGEFNPTNISDDFSKEASKKVKLKITFNNKEYVKDFQKYEDWVDPEIFVLSSFFRK